MNLTAPRWLLAAAAAVTAAFPAAPLRAGEGGQAAAASRTARFDTVEQTAATYREALEAGDLAAARKLIGKRGTFRGTVARVFTPKGGNLVILNFAEDYKTAVTAVLRKPDFSRFPDLGGLPGKEILVTGKLVDYEGRPEIELKTPGQIRLVR
jgi:outer membrane receptor protein involved in Fe transport